MVSYRNLEVEAILCLSWRKSSERSVYSTKSLISAADPTFNPTQEKHPFNSLKKIRKESFRILGWWQGGEGKWEGILQNKLVHVMQPLTFIRNPISGRDGRSGSACRDRQSLEFPATRSQCEPQTLLLAPPSFPPKEPSCQLLPGGLLFPLPPGLHPEPGVLVAGSSSSPPLAWVRPSPLWILEHSGVWKAPLFLVLNQQSCYCHFPSDRHLPRIQNYTQLQTIDTPLNKKMVLINLYISLWDKKNLYHEIYKCISVLWKFY